MKRLLYIVFLISLFGSSYSQSIVQRTTGANTVNDPRLMASLNLFAPRYPDTTAANLQKGIDTCGALIYTYDIQGYWFRQCQLDGSKKWSQISGSGSASVTNITVGNLPPIFTSSVLNPTTTPAISFSLTNASPYTVFGRGSGMGAPSYLSSLDSNWIPSLHSQGYYDGRFVHLTGNETIAGNKTFTGYIIPPGTGTNSTRIGNLTTAGAQESTVMGYLARDSITAIDPTYFGGWPTNVGSRSWGPGTAYGWMAGTGNYEAVAIGPHAYAQGLASAALGDGAKAFLTNEFVVGDAAYSRGNISVFIGGGSGLDHDMTGCFDCWGSSSSYSWSFSNAPHQGFLFAYNDTLVTQWQQGEGMVNDIWLGGPISTRRPHAITLNMTDRSTGTDSSGIDFSILGSGGRGAGTPGKILLKTATAGSTGNTAQTKSTVLSVAGGGLVGINTESPTSPLDIRASSLKIADFKNTSISIVDIYGKSDSTTSIALVRDGQNTTNYAYGSLAIDNSNTTIGVSGVSLSAAGIGTRKVVPITLGFYRDQIGYTTGLKIDTTGFIGLGGFTTPSAWLDLRNSGGSGIQRGQNVLLGPSGNGNGSSIALGTTASVLAITMAQQTAANTGFWAVQTANSGSVAERWRIDNLGGFTNTGATATAYIHLKAGTTAASTAPIKLTAGTNMTTPEAGAIEFDGTNYFATASSTRYTFAKTLTNTGTLDFASTNAQESSDLTITVTGAALSDAVILGVPNGSVVANSSFSAFVSATNTVTVRFNNYSSTSKDPASGSFRVSIVKY